MPGLNQLEPTKTSKLFQMIPTLVVKSELPGVSASCSQLGRDISAAIAVLDF